MGWKQSQRTLQLLCHGLDAFPRPTSARAQRRVRCTTVRRGPKGVRTTAVLARRRRREESGHRTGHVGRDRAIDGIEAHEGRVEVHLADGLPSLSLVDLARPRSRIRASARGAGAERVRVPAQQAHHRESCADRPAQGERPLRPADWARRPGRDPDAAAREPGSLQVRRRTAAGGQTAAGARRTCPGSTCGRPPRWCRRWRRRSKARPRPSCDAPMLAQ